jgi:hypothetical protein
MLTFDTTALLESLQRAHDDAVVGLENVAKGLAFELTERAIENTPLGDSNKYARYYQARQSLPQVEGLARGNWQFSGDSNFSLQIIAGKASGETALNIVESTSNNYVLGSTFYIGNATPYIGDLEADYSPQTNGHGIISPTISDITGAYQVNYQYYYDKGK